jgi:isoquinoline 1-oxidoreductase subunit beta
MEGYMPGSPASFSRRDALKGGAALTFALCLPSRTAGAQSATTAPADALTPNAFVRIGRDDVVTVFAKHLEMGQGIYTGLATIIAEELDADWNQMRVEGAPVNTALYNNLLWGAIQGTGGTTSIANSFEQLRQAGATARALLIAAAARQWQVPAAGITIDAGIVRHGSGKSAPFGELVSMAASLPVPGDARPKEPSAYTRIGRSMPRVDSRAKSTATAIYTQDVRLPGMLTAVVAHPPRFGCKVRGFDAAGAKAIEGVKAIVAFQTPVREGVAVVATNFWAAKKGRDALAIDWDESGAFTRSSDELFAEYRALARKPGDSARRDGDVDAAFGRVVRTLEATYEFPFLAHAAMEPMNCVVQLRENGCEVWNGEQFQTVDQLALARLLQVPPANVTIHQLYAGGSFGRRANPASDYILETAAIARAAALSDPLKLVWTREEDMRAGFYRPMYVHALRAGIDARGEIIAWQHRIVGQSIFTGTIFAPPGTIDPTSVGGAANLPYRIPNLSVELHTVRLPVPVQWWRAVGSTHTAFAVECFMDEIARMAGEDPYLVRRELLKDRPRHVAVLDLLAERSGWKQRRAADEYLGLAIHESFGTIVGNVAKVKRTASGLKLERVVCAVDCGLAINPNIVAMQMESGIAYGLCAALRGAITFKDGRVEQANFDDYAVLRMHEMPAVDVHILPSQGRPTGVGEPATPAIAPALANALAAMNNRPIRSLPLSAQGITFA